MKPVPRFVDLPPMLVAGMREPLGEQSEQTIPALWQKFSPYINNIPHQRDAAAYGLCVRMSESSNGNYYYMACCEVTEFNNLPDELSPFIVPAHKYAVFPHTEHVSSIRNTIDYIFDQWLPASGLIHNPQSIHFFERYGEEFDPVAGEGEMEIWLPLAA